MVVSKLYLGIDLAKILRVTLQKTFENLTE